MQQRCHLFCCVSWSQLDTCREDAVCVQVFDAWLCSVMCQDHKRTCTEKVLFVCKFIMFCSVLWCARITCRLRMEKIPLVLKCFMCGCVMLCVGIPCRSRMEKIPLGFKCSMRGCVPLCVRITSRWRMEKISLVFKCLMHDCVSLHVRITGRWRMEKIPLVFKRLMLGCVPLCARITSGHMRRRPHLCARCAARGSRAAATCTAMSSTDTRRRRNTAVTGVTAPLKPGNQQQSFELAQPHPHSHHHPHPHLHPHHLWHLHHRSPHCDQQQHWFCEQIRTRGVGCWYYEIGDIDGIFKDTNNDDLDSNNGSDSSYDNDWSKGLALTLLSQSLQGMAG